MLNYELKLNEAVQRSPQLKHKIKCLQHELEEVFQNKLYSKKFDYDININDLKAIFRIANKWLFKNRLNENDVSIIIIENSVNQKEKGTFRLGLNNNGKHQIGIVKYNKDNVFQIINVFLHEMIHLYDNLYGPLKDKASAKCVDTINNIQFVDHYDVHGKYFKDRCNRINAYGFAVKIKYSINDEKTMKKIQEKTKTTNVFFDEHNVDDEEYYKKVKFMYDSLANCNKDLVYRDAKHWYIQID